MTRSFVPGFTLSVFLLVLAVLPDHSSTLSGATCIPPENLGELAVLSDAVVAARAVASASESRGRMIFTRTEFVVEESLSGPLDGGVVFTVEAPGGEVDGRAWNVAGSPRFTGGVSYLLFLDRKADGVWRPAMLSYGLLEEVVAADGTRVLTPLPDVGFTSLFSRRDGLVPEGISTYQRAALLAHLRDVLDGREDWDTTSVVAEVEPLSRQLKGAPPQCTFFRNRGRGFRWSAFDTGGTATIFAQSPGDASLPGGGVDEILGALDMWMEISGTRFNLQYGGERAVALACSGGDDAEANVIIFNDPCSDISRLERCGGVLAFGGPLTSGVHRFDGETWETIVGWIVVVNDGAGCLGSTGYQSMLAHELGHGLGFGHVEDHNALMFASCCNTINVTDTVCALFLYPAEDADNERPEVDAGADRRIVIAGNTAFLSGTVIDDGRPAGSDVTVGWEQLNGPGSTVFGEPAALETSVSFSRSGAYLLRLSATDGEFVGSDYVRIEVETGVGSLTTVDFQQETGGYQGTVDTNLREGAPTVDSSRRIELEVDAREPDASDSESQVLLRFDDVFGAGPGQVPPGATIRSAVLSLSTTNVGDGASFRRMLVDWSDRVTWSDFENRGVTAGREALSSLDATATGSDGTVEVDVTASVSAWSEDPCSNYGWALLPRGTNGWRFHSAEGEIPPRLSIEYTLQPEETLIAIGDRWTFFKGLEDPPVDWNLTSFQPLAEDERWFEGATGIGYGDGDDLTVLNDMEDRYLTLYARREFSVEAPEKLRRLHLKIDYDDGFVAYLNGEEVARSKSMGAAGSPVERNTQSDAREAGKSELYELDTSVLAAGVNVLAVEVHNSALSSGDLSFIPQLQAISSPLESGDAWTFRRGIAPIPEDWNQETFDDSEWEVGRTGIGYGDGDDRTVLNDMQGNYISLYARRIFDIAPVERASAYSLTVIYDDGVVVYLNGAELGRANLPAGEITPATAASQTGEGEVVVFSVEREMLRDGPNLLAASVHNAQLASSDLSFDAVLVPLRTDVRVVDCDAPEPMIRRGDVTDDAGVTIADAVALLSFLFESGSTPPCLDAADVDDDGSLTISDAVSVLGFLFSGGTLAEPGETCGVDPSEDELGECASAECASR